MKKYIVFIFILMIIQFQADAQTFLLIDRRWYQPAIQTDTVSREQLTEGWFPIYKTDLDSLITLVFKLKNLREDGLKRKFYYSEDFKTSNLTFEIENIKRTYGDGYEINIVSIGPFGKNTLKLADPRLLLNENQKVVRSFLTYLYRIKKDLDKPVKDKKKNTKNNPMVD